jgi:hypothetical protein
VVIPIALAFYSAKVQESTQRESINRDYVQLTVAILKEKRDDVDRDLRVWAVDLLAERSPTKFSPAVIRALKSGAVSLPISGTTDHIGETTTVCGTVASTQLPSWCQKRSCCGAVG